MGESKRLVGMDMLSKEGLCSMIALICLFALQSFKHRGKYEKAAGKSLDENEGQGCQK